MEEKRVRRTAEQIAADLDAQVEQLMGSIDGIEEKKAAACAEYDRKIDSVREKIAKLEERKKALFTPKKRKPRKKKANQIKELMDVLKAMNGGDGFAQPVEIRVAVDCPKRGFIGGLHTDFKLNQTGAHIAQDGKLLVGD